MPRVAQFAAALWLTAVAAVWPQSNTVLQDFKFDPFAEPPSAQFRFSQTPDVTTTLSQDGALRTLTLTCVGTANEATQEDYTRQFPAGYAIRELNIRESLTDEGRALVIRVVTAGGWEPQLAPTLSSHSLYVRIVPATTVAPVLPVEQPEVATSSEADDSTWGMFTAVMWLWLSAFGVIAFVGGAVAARFLFHWGWNRVQDRAERRATITVEDVRHTRSEIDKFQQDAAAALGSVATRQAELSQVVSGDLDRVRDEIRGLVSEFNQATQSVLLFADPAKPAEPPAPREDDIILEPESAVRGESVGSVTIAGAETAGTGEKTPYAQARELLRAETDPREIAKRTGLSLGEVQFLAQTEGLRGELRNPA